MRTQALEADPVRVTSVIATAGHWNTRRNAVDFVVVGAQKAGTTSLHHYLERHVGIRLPLQKETEFFSREDLYARGAHWYRETHFQHARPDELCGEVCPQYMFDVSAPARLAALAPSAHLIMLLRDPVERAYSHYQMTVRRGLERRTLDDMLDHEIAAATRGSPNRSPHHGYLWGGLYGLAITRYLEHFPREVLGVFFAEDLKRQRVATFASILQAIGSRAKVDPGALVRSYNVGGEDRFPRLRTLTARAAHAVLPLVGARGEARLRRLWLWYETELSIRREGTATLPAAPAERLREFYASDVLAVARHVGRRPPWPRFDREFAAAGI
jgi:hypothetical protein